MTVRIWLSEIHFSDDSKIAIDKDEIVVLVGPNNAGKSTSLKEIAALLRSNQTEGKVLKKITIEKDGSETELISFLTNILKKETAATPSPIYRGSRANVSERNAIDYWNDFKNGLSELASIFVNSLTTEERLKAANPPNSIDFTKEVPQHPIHFLQHDDSLEKEFSIYFKQAFGTDLIVNRNAGSIVPLYVGNRPIPKNGEDRVSIGYLKELEKLDLLHEQGDGMRSFVGVLLNAFISNHSILLIDEPEAFLHPPQAKLLGKMLSRKRERQLFLATHSEDFLKGLLDADATNLKIIRLQRDGKINKVSALNSSGINKIWNDPLLRYSNILNGLFHSKVVVCESDSDCRFFAAILAALHDNTDTAIPDVLFVHCGGKHRIPVAIEALKELNVPIRVVSDFDVLNDITPLKEIFEQLDGTWADVEKDWKLVKTSIDQKRPKLETTEIKKKIDEVFESTSEPVFPKEKISEIKKILRTTSAWAEAKEVGKAYIPSGDPTNAFERIQSKFKEKGLFVVEVGELESFVKSVPNHGPKWVNEVLTKDLKTDIELESARQFVTQLMS